MMAPSPKDSLAIAALAKSLYPFLPGSRFSTVAAAAGVGDFWFSGSKMPAIEQLISNTLQNRRGRFCTLVEMVVSEGVRYRERKNNPVHREEIEEINKSIQELGFKIPSLWDPLFLDSLPRSEAEHPATENKASGPKPETLKTLEHQFLQVEKLAPHPRGLAFQDFLNDLFKVYGFNPRPSFRIVGEEIDGSLQLDHETYLLEAKWQKSPVAKRDLVHLNDKVESHSKLGRGIFIALGSFSEEGVEAFGKGRSIFGLDGQDMYFIIHEKLPLDEILRRKLRWLIETGSFHYPVLRFKNELQHVGELL